MGRKASERYHNRVARQYDSIYDDAYWAFHDEITWRQVKPHLPRDATAHCADLGCGTGKWGLKLLKSGYPTTFLDSSAAMIEATRAKTEAMGPRARKATLVVADIADMPQLESAKFYLVTAMGDPLSICSDPPAAVREFARISAPGGIIIATTDNKLAAINYYIERGNLDALETFLKTSKTNWLTKDAREQFELTTFTPSTLKKLFEQFGFEVIDVAGKTILPVRENRKLLESPDAVDRLIRLEEQLSRDISTAASAGHLQITARRRGS